MYGLTWINWNNLKTCSSGTRRHRHFFQIADDPKKQGVGASSLKAELSQWPKYAAKLVVLVKEASILDQKISADNQTLFFSQNSFIILKIFGFLSKSWVASSLFQLSRPAAPFSGDARLINLFLPNISKGCYRHNDYLFSVLSPVAFPSACSFFILNIKFCCLSDNIDAF